MRCPCRLLLLATWALLAFAPGAFARESSAPMKLVAPLDGAVLVAGSEAELEWAPDEAFDRFPRVEEWEAFLSLDGGATWPLRITPHLDQDIRRVHWQVPSVPTADARLLLRFGDEEEETAVEWPGRFSIVASPITSGGSFALSRPAPGLGEAALPGHTGVVAWVEGSRRGGSMHPVIAARQLSLRERLAPPVSHRETAEIAGGPAPSDPPGSVLRSAFSAAPEGLRSRLARAGTGPAAFPDILLLIQRQNE